MGKEKRNGHISSLINNRVGSWEKDEDSALFCFEVGWACYSFITDTKKKNPKIKK